MAAAWRYPQCRGISRPQLEDLYQETVLALLNRPFVSEEHLRNALRVGLRNRALHVHRDERRRGEILAAHAPDVHRATQRRGEGEEPERAALTREDGLIVLEFACGLSELEQQVYALEAEGLRYRAIAPILGVSVNQAHKASRELAEKYARFQLLHDTGRLCGYRAPTIKALLAGEETSEQLARAAFAHLRSCAQCRSEHRTNAARLKRSFHERAAALLPIGALAHHERTQGLLLRAKLLTHRLLSTGMPGGGARERGLALLAGGGASAKVAAGVATVVAVAGGTFTAAGALHHAPVHHHRVHVRSASTRIPAAAPEESAAAVRVPAAVTTSASGSVLTHEAQGAKTHKADPARREPGGFAFLGVPAAAGHGSARASTAHAADTEASTAPIAAVPARSGASASGQGSGGESQHGGGPFSP
ncbi:MAG TPA: sigma-70 family RNA polymerase sigma factor [Solirubrobacteraceae bacterium]|nr:sigma-70 family RNA polymerase sigma factor [Solirubrobacteraceae bacterium]